MKVVILTTDNREHWKQYELPNPVFGTAPEALLEGFALLPNVEVHVVSCVRKPVCSAKKIGRNIYYHSVLVPKCGWLNSAYMGCIRAVQRKLREIGPDIVHGQGTERDCAISAVYSKYPNVVTIHGNMAEVSRFFRARALSYHWLVARLEDWTLPRTNGVFCNSVYTESMVKPRSKKTWRVANALRGAFFKPVPPTLRTEIPTILNVGVISPLKRQVEILRIAEELFQEGVRVRFLFVGMLGNGEYAERFREGIAVAERLGYASYLGVKSLNDLVDLFDQSHALVHFSSEEAFGLVVAEALTRNLKFFGAAEGGVVDIARGVQLAELHPQDNWCSLKQGIIRWLKAGCPQPVSAAAEMAERYHPKTIAMQHLKIYKEVLNEH